MTLSIEDAAVAYVQAVRARAEAKETSGALYSSRGRSCANYAAYVREEMDVLNPYAHDYMGCNQCESCKVATAAYEAYQKAAHWQGVAWKRLKKACAT